MKVKTYTPEQEAGFVETLKQIQRSIPQAMIDAAVTQKKLTPTIEKVMNEALVTEGISEEKKTEIRHLMDVGTFSKEAVLENEKAVKMIDNFVNRAINKAIKEGRLPPRSHVKMLPSVIKANKNPDEKN